MSMGSPIKSTGSVVLLSKNFSIKMNFKDQIYLEKTKKPTTQRMGFYIKTSPKYQVYRLQIIFIEDIFVQILHILRSGT